ncbi:MAG TPA: glutathione S-transferase family protein [Arenimonas sp.]|uniref:glutathione S-transferase family protein n=1 Tax=Arenimonas sp. TaxID=1872635 RepID=UPI002D803574|nr:glutathione S-transferase family protein [Arenimonas sp.]HEU0153254.1 glutathione S-transferase family protein [Arenimonas sp.]
MPLVLYGHPFSSYTQKVLIVLYENATPFELRTIYGGLPEHFADWARRWPLRKFPVLVDGERQVAESSIINEYLQLAHPGPVRLMPDDAGDQLDMRFMERFFDLHVMDAAQHAVNGALSGDEAKRRDGLQTSIGKLEPAYAWLEENLPEADWACGAQYTLADCAASPALFYADWVHPIPDALPRLRAYRSRLLARPAFARAVDEARPFRSLFPLGAPARD